MVKGILASAGAMRPAMLAQEVMANNLANASTKGFRQDRYAFQQMMSSAINTTSLSDVATAPQLTTKLDTTPGAYQVTERKLDFAVQGDGYFVVQTPDGERFTRAGHFQVTQEGVVATAEGYPLLTDGGPITVTEAENLFVSASGDVREGNQNLGKLQVVNFDAATSLTHAGGGLMIAEGEAAPVEAIQVMQGVLEGPNVDSVQTMVEMITLLRHFEMNQKALQAQDDSLGNLLNWVKA